ncbi:hypothetical protein niasHT_018075 [Heterodera trifolii]|uniref:Uncharacterized protein n=1 Tax=Heterodera trifolii TaxID=157864 RepID=A0ABD2LKG4_9BILA
MDMGGGDSVPGRKKSAGGGRKKVTFFGTDDDYGTPMGPQQHQQQQLVEQQQQQRRHHQHVDGMVRRIGTPPPLIDDKGPSPKNDNGCGGGGVADVDELLAENDQLRRTISDMEKQQQQHQAVSNTTTVGEPLPSSVLILKAKAAAHAKIRELEAALAQNQRQAETERAELQSFIDQLKESREWALEENGKLLQQLGVAKQKCDDLHGELDASLETSAIFRRRLDENVARMDTLCTELYQSRAQTQQALDDKNIMAAEVERLKDAIFAQDEFIGMLEGDLLVYEAHVGILRDSLGATKREDRQHIKSKAFSAKLNALEMEKQEIAKRNNDEKLRVKALAVKVRYLEEERDELNARLRHYEREYGISREQPYEQQKRNAIDESIQCTSSTVLNLEDDSSGPIDSSSPTNVADCATLSNTAGDQSDQQQQQQQQIQPNDVENDAAALAAEQLQIHAQQFQAVQALKREADERVQQLELELTTVRQSVHKFVASITGRPIPAPFNQILSSSNTNADGGIAFNDVADLDSVERLIDELLHNYGTLTEVRAELERQVEQLNEQIERAEADHAEKEHKLHDGVDQLHVQLQQCQGQIDVAQCRIDNLTRTEAEMARELGTRQRELSSATAELNSFREAKRQLEEQRAELFAQIDALNGTKSALSAELQQANTANATLSSTLSSEQQRLNRLINLLTGIVDHFRSSYANNDGTLTSAIAPLYSSESLDNFMRCIEAKTEAATTELALTPAAEQCPSIADVQSTELISPAANQSMVISPVQLSVINPTVAVAADVEQHGQQQHDLQQHMAENAESSLAPEAVMITSSTKTDDLLFTKHVAVQAAAKQIDNGAQTLSLDELNEPLFRQISEQQQQHDQDVQHKFALYKQQIEQLQHQLQSVQHNAEQQLATVTTRRECLEQQLVKSGTRVGCLEAKIEQLEQELTVIRAELSQTALKLEEEELAHLAQCNANGQLEAEIGALREANEQLNECISEQSTAVAVVEENTRNTVCQLLANVDPEFASPSIEQQQRQSNCLMLVDAGTQSSSNDFPSAITLTAAANDGANHETGGGAEQQQADDQQRLQRQLLLECINDRQQFEHELGQNVQQLLALKTELESSVDVLRAEIWALNDEMKKKFEESDTLSQRLHSADSQLATLRAENGQLLAKLRDTEQQMGALNTAMEKHGEVREQLEVANRRIDELMSEKEMEMLRMNETVVELNARIAELEAANAAFSIEIQGLTNRLQQLQSSLLEAKNLLGSWRTDLLNLREQQQQFVTQSNCSIDSAHKMATQAVEEAKAARLVTKSRDVDALVRENQHLINTNARLQHKLDQYSNNNNNDEEEDGDKDGEENKSAAQVPPTPQPPVIDLTNYHEDDGVEEEERPYEKQDDHCENGEAERHHELQDDQCESGEAGRNGKQSDQTVEDEQYDQMGHEKQTDHCGNEELDDSWGWDEQEGGEDQRSDQKECEKHTDRKGHKEQTDHCGNEELNDSWGWDEQGGGEERSDQKECEKHTDRKGHKEQTDHCGNEELDDSWGWNEQGDGEDQRSDQNEYEKHIDRKGHKEQTDHCGNEELDDSWGWNEQGDGEDQRSDQNEYEKHIDQKEYEKQTDHFGNKELDDSWGCNEQEGGEDQRSDQKEREEQTEIGQKQEKRFDQYEEAAASEPKKTIFDNLVDWAWGDK